MRKIKESLLKEYIHQILREEGDYGYDDTPYHAMGMGGMGFVPSGSLISAFGTPFVDVIKTAIGKTKELTTRVRTLATVSWGAILSTLVPALRADYAKVFDEEKARLEKIRGEYSDVYRRTNEAFKGDAVMLAWMASPALVMGAMAAKTAPSVTKGLLGAATGGLSDDIFDSTKSKLKSLGRWMIGNKGAKSAPSKKDPRNIFGESRLHEEEEKPSGKNYSAKDLLSNPKFIAKALDNPQVEKMQKAAREVYMKTLEETVQIAKKTVSDLRTFDDLKKTIANKKMPEEMKKQIDELSKLEGEEKQKAEKVLLKTIKASMKQFYIKSLEDRVKKVVSQGVPEEAQYVKDHKEAIQKIKAL